MAWAIVGTMVTVAGCTGATAPEPVATQPGARPVGSTTLDRPSEEAEFQNTGTIAGLVIDEELLPIAEAFVSVAKLDAELLTGLDGRFEFQNVPAGRHVVEVQAQGYVGRAEARQVTSQEPTYIQFTLEPLPVLEPYVEIRNHVTMIHYAVGATLNYWVEPSCSDTCWWTSPLETEPSFFIVEITGKHSVSKPTGPDALDFAIYKNSISGGTIWWCNWYGAPPTCNHLPLRVEFNATVLFEAKPAGELAKALYISHRCDPFWICLEDRYETWLSLFHHHEGIAIPEDYTARPPE